MSECVVRMEMPQGCWCCPFGHYDWIWGDDGREKMVCFCCLDGESEEDGHYLLETELKRPSWCPIICSLPDWHGRLVDVDKLFRVIPLKVCVPCPFGEEKECADCVIEKVMEMIDNDTTIVPVERRVNDGTDKA